tara:strand:+ start:240 stop:557 length:318 start_codon:yes stop_codon:yes gene_type:complete
MYFATFHYKGNIVHKQLFKNDVTEDLKNQADRLILHTLKSGVSLKQQIQTYKNLLQSNIRKKFYNYPISKTDNKLAGFAVFTLIKLKQIKEDDKNGLIITKAKKR